MCNIVHFWFNKKNLSTDYFVPIWPLNIVNEVKRMIQDITSLYQLIHAPVSFISLNVV